MIFDIQKYLDQRISHNDIEIIYIDVVYMKKHDVIKRIYFRYYYKTWKSDPNSNQWNSEEEYQKWKDEPQRRDKKEAQYLSFIELKDFNEFNNNKHKSYFDSLNGIKKFAL